MIHYIILRCINFPRLLTRNIIQYKTCQQGRIIWYLKIKYVNYFCEKVPLLLKDICGCFIEIKISLEKSLDEIVSVKGC